jgi:hypothetical protein
MVKGKDQLENAATENPALAEVLSKVGKAETQETVNVEKVRKFDPRNVLGGGIKTIIDKELGEISFGELTIGDLFEINKIKDEQEKGLAVLWLMLRRACPELLFDEVKVYPQGIAVRLLDVLGKHSSFLQLKPTT